MVFWNGIHYYGNHVGFRAGFFRERVLIKQGLFILLQGLMCVLLILHEDLYFAKLF